MKSDEEAHSTKRPPADPDEPEEENTHADIMGAIQRAKTNAARGSIPDRAGPALATAKINKFDLAQALALTTANGEAVHHPSSRPPREDDAPFVAGEVEVVGEEEVVTGRESLPGRDSIPGRDSVAPASSRPSRMPAEVKISIKPLPVAATPPAFVDTSAIEPPKRSGRLARAIVAALVGALLGLLVIGYVYARTR